MPFIIINSAGSIKQATPAGTNGATGSQGPIGIPGSDGEDGQNGIPGTPGPQGVAGSNGSNGAPGSMGPPGPDGDTGDDFSFVGFPPVGSNVFTEQTTTVTGTQNDFSLSAPTTYLRCNNASALTLTGFTIQGATALAGHRLIIDNVGTSTVKVAYQTGSSAVNQTLTPSTNGQIIGAGGRMLAVYDGTTTRWRVTCVNPGTSISVAYGDCAFTGTGSLVWTVASGDFEYLQYQQTNNNVWFSLRFSATTVSGVGNTLIVSVSSAVPGGFTITRSIAGLFCRAIDNGNVDVGYVGISAAIRFSKRDLTNWAASTDNTQVDANFCLTGVD